MRLIFLIFLFLSLYSSESLAQDSTKKAPSSDKYLLHLNIPSDWLVKRQIEGRDYTMSASSPDDLFYLYYVQFMEDEKSRPKRYLETYRSQFGMDSAKREILNKKIKGKKTRFYLAKDKGEFIDEHFKIMIIATAINKINAIAYVIYPLNADKSTDDKMRKILIGD